MDSHCIVEIALSGWGDNASVWFFAFGISIHTAHLYRDSKALRNFIAAHANDMDTNNVFLLALYDQFIRCGLLVFFGEHGEVHCLERRFVWEHRQVSEGTT